MRLQQEFSERLLYEYKFLQSTTEREKLVSPWDVMALEKVAPGKIIVSSSSPRLRRYMTSRTTPLRTLKPDSLIDSEINTSLDTQVIFEHVANYKEPAQKWTTEGDDGLSREKAVQTLLLTIVKLLATGETEIPQHLTLLGRDYVVMSDARELVDKPDFGSVSTTGRSILLEGRPNVRLEGPPEQMNRLYTFQKHDSRYLLHMNSSTILRTNNKIHITDSLIASLMEGNIETRSVGVITQLSALIMDIPKIFDFDDPQSPTYKLWKVLSDFGYDKGGSRLYQIPGVVDWERWGDYLRVWLPHTTSLAKTPQRMLDMFTTGSSLGDWKKITQLPNSFAKQIRGLMVGVDQGFFNRYLAT